MHVEPELADVRKLRNTSAVTLLLVALGGLLETVVLGLGGGTITKLQCMKQIGLFAIVSALATGHFLYWAFKLRKFEKEGCSMEMVRVGRAIALGILWVVAVFGLASVAASKCDFTIAFMSGFVITFFAVSFSFVICRMLGK